MRENGHGRYLDKLAEQSEARFIIVLLIMNCFTMIGEVIVMIPGKCSA
jgi:hypothetical protein